MRMGSIEQEPEPAHGWVDLTANRPGAAARQRAVQERKAAPVRTAVARFFGVHTNERAWRIGADGEQQVAVQLARLPDPWRTLHAVPVGSRGADIDHVVIGPSGVFTINTKHHRSARVWVDGEVVKIGATSVPYVRNSRFEADRAARLLSQAMGAQIRVTALVVVLCANLVVARVPPPGVIITGPRGMLRGLGSLPPVLDQVAVEALFEVAHRSTTWSPPRPGPRS
jgi:hypothetical protein